MEAKDIVLAVIDYEEGEFTGNTLLQKRIFFLNEMLNMGITFKPHYYGPYSEEVASAINTLVGLSFLMKSEEAFPSDKNIWGEIKRYTYKLTVEGTEIVNEIKTDNEYARLRKYLNKMGAFSETKDYQKLSRAAKVFHIVKLKGKTTTEKTKEEAHRLGWKLAPREIQDVTSFLVDMKLVRVE